jgi:hypothetical protein
MFRQPQTLSLSPYVITFSIAAFILVTARSAVTSHVPNASDIEQAN